MYLLYLSECNKAERAVCISSNNLEHVSGSINRVRSGLFAAEPATDYLVKQPPMWRLVPWQLLRCGNVLVTVFKNSADRQIATFVFRKLSGK